MNSPDEPTSPPNRRNKVHPLGVVVLGVILFALAVFVLRDRTPSLTREIYQANLDRWLRSGVGSYDSTMRIDLPGQDASLYEVEVRSGQVVSLKINGNESKRGDGYSILRLFDILDRELEFADGGAVREPGLPEGAVLRADFDAELGYPRKFMRLATKNKSVFIELTQFHLVESGGDKEK